MNNKTLCDEMRAEAHKLATDRRDDASVLLYDAADEIDRLRDALREIASRATDSDGVLATTAILANLTACVDAARTVLG